MLILLKINSYRFGKIKIGGQIYTNDVIIFPDHVEGNWWRKEGHSLALEDLDTVLPPRASKPDFLLVGTGAYGALKIPTALIEHLEDLGIEIVSGPTKEICEKHESLASSAKNLTVVTALHLTC